MPSIAELSEKGLLRFLAKDISDFANMFNFMTAKSIGYYRNDWNIECHFSVPREELGLRPNKKPGDIDVLLIPAFDGERFAERAMAIEAKRFVLDPERRDRSPSSFGTDQVAGLADDGFPLVGLLHVPIVKPSPREEWVEIKVHKLSRAQGEGPFEGTISIDPAVDQLTIRHEGRIEKLVLQKSIGYNIFSIHISEAGDRVIGYSVRSWRSPEKNERTDPNLVAAIRKLDRTPDCEACFVSGGGHVANYNPDKYE